MLPALADVGAILGGNGNDGLSSLSLLAPTVVGIALLYGIYSVR